MTEFYSTQDQAFDDFDRAGVHDASEIVAEVEYQTDDPDAFDHDDIMGRNPEFAFTINDAMQQSQDNDKGGLDRQAWAEALKDPESAKRIHAGVMACRQAIEDAQKNRRV